MDHPAVIFRFISDWKRRQGMAFREVLVRQVREVLRAWLAGAGKRPAARRAGVDVKTAQRYIKAAQAAGLARGGDESQLTDELLGQVVAAVRPARPAGHGSSWEALAERGDDITGWVKDDLTLVIVGTTSDVRVTDPLVDHLGLLHCGRPVRLGDGGLADPFLCSRFFQLAVDSASQG